MSFSGNFYFGWILYDLICIVLILMRGRQIASSQRRILFGLFCFSFAFLAIFGNSITPDTLNYREIVKEVSVTKNPFTHIEEFYVWLIHQIGNNFMLFQICIYAPIFFILYQIFTKGIELQNPALFLLLFAVLTLYDAIAGRSYLFTLVYLAGIVLLTRKKTVFGIAFLAGSFFLHKVAYIGLPLTVLYFVPWKLNRKTFLFIVILLGGMIAWGRHVIDYNLIDTIDTLSSAGVRGANYLTRTEGVHEGGSLWWTVIGNYRKYVRLILSFWVLWHLREIASMPSLSATRVMYFMLLWITLTSIFFYGINLPDATIAGRIAALGGIPLCYMLSICPQYMRLTRTQKFVFFLICFFYLLFNNAYIVGVRNILL